MPGLPIRSADEPVKQVAPFLRTRPQPEATCHVERGIHHSLLVQRADLTANLDATIKNPLEGIPKHELMTQVEDFADEKCLSEYTDLLKKGALIAQDPENYHDLPGEHRLTEEERDALHSELQHKWRVPKMLYMTILTCSIGAAVQGWDQEGSNGANLSFPQALGLDVTSPYGTYVLGLINSGPYIGSSLLGCWVSDPLNFYFGAIFIAANFCFWAVIGSACAQTWEQLLLCRLLVGIGMGVNGSSVPIFAAENSPAAIRGALVLSWQLWTAFGICLGTCANLVVGRTGSISWRLQFGSALIPAVPLMVTVFFCPESPRWYMKKNRYPEAMSSLLRLRHHPVQAARDLYYIHAQLEVEREIIHGSTYIRRFIELFTIPRLRRATLASFVVMIAQQMCGINIIAFYSSSIFEEAGTTAYNALIASFGFGLVNFIFAWPAIWTIDTFGRRSLLLFTFPNMAWALLAAGLCNLIPGTGSTHLGLVAVFIYIFAAFYSPGEGPVPFVYSAEAVATCFFWASVLTVSFPAILKAFGVVGSFCLYAGLNLVALVMIFLFVPETKQRTLEELDYIFAVPTHTFINYQLKVWLPWFIKRHVLFDRGAKLKPLYHFDLVGRIAGGESDTTSSNALGDQGGDQKDEKAA
ncbi:hypothetical protein KVR01_007972 [Diaporthe batatas]|uniref:uncharacterized protein n=1 Tax=Diaporthe batatas TaxID=748121 RepID=UPI001D055CEF|nr:uncharacterized protein KVR01_007972 [Diaporthe batatas]KAG8162207.1 hypothetical protein KVR01_007972 [Diaporthe batatas]